MMSLDCLYMIILRIIRLFILLGKSYVRKWTEAKPYFIQFIRD